MILPILELSFVVLAALLTTLNRIFALLYIVAIVIDVVRDFHHDEMVRFYRSRANTYTLAILGIFFSFLIAFSEKINLDMLNTFVVFGFIIKNLLSADRILERNKLIKWVGGLFGILVLLFTLLSHGFTAEGFIESAIGFYVLFATFVALRWRFVGFAMFSAIAGFFLYFFIKSLAKGVFTTGKIVTLLFVIFPLVYLSIQSLRREERP